VGTAADVLVEIKPTVYIELAGMAIVVGNPVKRSWDKMTASMRPGRPSLPSLTIHVAAGLVQPDAVFLYSLQLRRPHSRRDMQLDPQVLMPRLKAPPSSSGGSSGSDERHPCLGTGQ
jgi:hypothetical protein